MSAQCDQWDVDTVPARRCNQSGVNVRLPCPVGRPDATACYCDDHGGEIRARREAERDWNYLAPESVGDAGAVMAAGCAQLTTINAYLVIRQTPPPQGSVWLAWLGLGSLLTPVGRPGAVPSRRAGQKHRRAHSPGVAHVTGVRSFDSRAEAVLAGIGAWAERLNADVATIRRARGGTLAWGVPVEPLLSPIMVEVAPDQNAWDVAIQQPRVAGVGLGRITGLRASGEAL